MSNDLSLRAKSCLCAYITVGWGAVYLPQLPVLQQSPVTVTVTRGASLTSEVYDGRVPTGGVLGVTAVHAQVGVPYPGDPQSVPVPLLVPPVVGLVQRGALDAVPRHLTGRRGGGSEVQGRGRDVVGVYLFIYFYLFIYYTYQTYSL